MTTKFHRHYQGLQAILKDDKLITTGLTEVGAGVAATYLDAFNSSMKEIPELIVGPHKNQSMAKLVTSLKK